MSPGAMQRPTSEPPRRGHALADLRVNYESVEPCPLHEQSVARLLQVSLNMENWPRRRETFRRSRIQSYCHAGENAMRTTKQMSVTLPHEMADMVHSKVVSGEYASESEVIREGLRALAARDRAVEAWLRDQVQPAYDRLLAHPESGLSAGEVRARLASLPQQ
jgi:antitoxin ParD1/3/4